MRSRLRGLAKVRIDDPNMTTGAKAHADRKTFGRPSYWCATRQQFEAGEALLDLVAFLTTHLIGRDRDLAAFPLRDRGFDSIVFKGFAVPVRIVCTVSQEMFGGRLADHEALIRRCGDAGLAATFITHPGLAFRYAVAFVSGDRPTQYD